MQITLMDAKDYNLVIKNYMMRIQVNRQYDTQFQTKETRYVAFWGFTVGQRANGGGVKRKPERVTDEARQITMELRNKYKQMHLRVHNSADVAKLRSITKKREISSKPM